MIWNKYLECIIREDKEHENAHILNLVKQSFKNESAAILTDMLRRRSQFTPTLSLVAEVNRSIVGYILLSPIHIQSGQSLLDTLWLEPVCVLPKFQKKGIGSALIRQGLDKGRNLGFNSVFVIGAKEYYSRFGFVEAKNLGINSSFYLPSESFRVMEFAPNVLPSDGKLIFPEEIFGSM